MAINFLDNVQFNQNQLLGARIENVTSDPTSANGGDIIFNSTSGKLKYYDGTTPFSASGWIDPTAGTYTSWSIVGDGGTGSLTVSDGEEVDFAGGTGISTSLAIGVGTRTMTFNLDNTAVTAGSYNSANITVDAQGRITSATAGSVGTMSSWNLVAPNGLTPQSITNNENVTFAQGNGISSTISMPSGSTTLTIANTKPFDSLTLASTSGSNSTIANSGTITLAAGAGITTTNNGSGQVTIAATGAGTMSSWTLSGDSGTNQSITDGNTVDIAGGVGITTVASATDTLTVATDLNELPSLTPAGGQNDSLVFLYDGSDQGKAGIDSFPINEFGAANGTLSMGNNIITNLATPSGTTDAATKAYVDSAVAGGLNVKGGFNANTGAIATGGNLTSGGSRVAIAIGDYYVVTVAGNFFGQASTPLTPGDSVLVQTAAAAGASTIDDFAVIQSDTDLATLTTVGIGNVNVDTATNGRGLAVSYGSGTATAGLNIKSAFPELTSNVGTPGTNDRLIIWDGTSGNQGNYYVLLGDLTKGMQQLNSFAGTSSSGTTHTFNHNLNSLDVIVQVYDASNNETVYASVDRTSVNQVVVTTAASANIRCLVQAIG